MKDSIVTNLLGTDYLTVLLLWSMVLNIILIGAVVLLMVRLAAVSDTSDEDHDASLDDTQENVIH